MPQTFYVAPDEEILSVVSRLRSSALLENVFVVPKRALILQSIVNLRMLVREAEKLGKTVVIVTQDEQGRALAEKLGLPTRTYSNDLKMREEESAAEIDRDSNMEPQSPMPAPKNLGSDDFFSGDNRPSEIQSLPQEEFAAPKAASETRIRIRDNTPRRLTSLNSAVSQTDYSPSAMKNNPLGTPDGPERIRKTLPTEQLLPVSTPPARSIGQKTTPHHPAVTHASTGATHDYRQGSAAPDNRIQQFFGQKQSQRTPSTPKQSSRPAPVEVPIGKHGKFWLSFLAISSILSLLGVGLFLFFPKAEVYITPQSRTETVSFPFSGVMEGKDAENGAIRIRLIEEDEEEVVSVDASGVSSQGASKAKGTVVLSNSYGKDPQPLVATTRIESADGKIFRLVKGTTIPGTTKINGSELPGAIEAEVIADQPGEAYNLPAETIFTIPGFKGNSKYAQFSAKSKNAFSGGGSGTDSTESGSTSVTATDIEKGKKDAEERFRTSFEAMIRSKLGADERFVPGSEVIAMQGSATYPDIGIVAQSFEYRATFKGRAYVFSEGPVKKSIETLLLEKIGKESVTLMPEDISITYDEAIPDFDSGTLAIKTTVSATLFSKVDTEKMRESLTGKNSDDIKALLEQFPEIRKIEIDLKPNFLALSIPKNKDHINVILKKE